MSCRQYHQQYDFAKAGGYGADSVILSPVPGCLHSPPHFVCNSTMCMTCTSPMQFSKICGAGGTSRRPRNVPRVVAARLSISGLKSLITETENTLDLEMWRHCDIIIFDGLEVAGGLCQLLESATVYLPFLKELKQRHPFLKLYLNFANVTEEYEAYYGSTDFWQTLEGCIQQYDFDGCEINVELVTHYPEKMADALLAFQWRHRTILTLPNNRKILQYVGGDMYRTLSELVQFVHVKSFGYLKFDAIQRTEHGSLCKMLPTFESGLGDFQRSCEWLLQYIDGLKLLGGMDTVALQYHLHAEEDIAKSISVVTSRDIESKKAGGEFVGQRRYHYTERFDESECASLMELKRARVVISYDNYRVRNAKLNFLRKFGGVLLGDLYYDLPIGHKNSLLRMVYSKLASRTVGGGGGEDKPGGEEQQDDHDSGAETVVIGPPAEPDSSSEELPADVQGLTLSGS